MAPAGGEGGVVIPKPLVSPLELSELSGRSWAQPYGRCRTLPPLPAASPVLRLQPPLTGLTDGGTHVTSAPPDASPTDGDVGLAA